MKQLLTFLFVSSLLACASPNKIPDDVLGINEMKPIVWDLMVAGSLSQMLHTKDTVALKKETFVQYANVFSVHHITKDQFYHSYTYYLQHPDKNKILMDSVTEYSNRKRELMFEKYK